MRSCKWRIACWGTWKEMTCLKCRVESVWLCNSFVDSYLIFEWLSFAPRCFNISRTKDANTIKVNSLLTYPSVAFQAWNSRILRCLCGVRPLIHYTSPWKHHDLPCRITCMDCNGRLEPDYKRKRRRYRTKPYGDFLDSMICIDTNQPLWNLWCLIEYWAHLKLCFLPWPDGLKDGKQHWLITEKEKDSNGPTVPLHLEDSVDHQN